MTELIEEEAMALLDPCPFCGSQAELWGNSYEGYAVVCRSCGVKLGWDENCFPEGHFYNHDFAKQHLAIEAWNTRK